MVEFDNFKEFYDKHPDLDNTEYYKEFPDANQSTIRSWKARLRQVVAPPMAPTPPPEPAPPKPDTSMDAEMVKLLCTQTKTPLNEFEGVDTKSALIVLKAKLKNMQLQPAEEPPKKGSTPNTSILPSPRPIGSSVRHFGIDPYIVFDGAKNEIRMEIPMDKLLKPEKNKEITSEIK